MGGSTAKNNNSMFLGKKYNMLTVIGFEHRKKSNGKYAWYWKVRCDCGNETVACPSKVINGHTKSCGCAKVDRCHELTKKYLTKHNGRHERLYRIWHGMKQRCYSDKSKDYKNYGGRGISICEEWKNDYASFREWSMNNGYSDNLTIDRIDVNGDYCPSNCRWVTNIVQANNTRSNTYVEIDGVNKTLKQWCDGLGLKYNTVHGRIFRGATPRAAILAGKYMSRDQYGKLEKRVL